MQCKSTEYVDDEKKPRKEREMADAILEVYMYSPDDLLAAKHRMFVHRNRAVCWAKSLGQEAELSGSYSKRR